MTTIRCYKIMNIVALNSLKLYFVPTRKAEENTCTQLENDVGQLRKGRELFKDKKERKKKQLRSLKLVKTLLITRI